MDYKIGLGQDSHKFIKNKPLILGGKFISHDSGMEGNSDGDVILHSLFNAISSALGGGSIGKYADPLCLEKGITDSAKYLKIVIKMMKESNWQINNISISIEAKEPRLEKHLDDIKNHIAGIFKIDSNQIGITVTSGEGLTSFGKGKGIQALSIVSLNKK